MSGGGPGSRSTLVIYVAAGCAACRTARELAEAVRRARPSHRVEVIDLAEHTDRRPVGVVGTPTYLLGDEVISLGNPTLQELLGRLDVTDRAR